MQEYYEFAKKLRSIVRRADTFGHDRQTVLEELLFAAENYEDVAESVEMKMIVEFQKESEAA
jgi:hypothetical protein